MQQRSIIHVRRALLTSAAAMALALGVETSDAAAQSAPRSPSLALATVWTYIDISHSTYRGSQFFGGDPTDGWTVTGGIGVPSSFGWGFALRGGYGSSDGGNPTYSGPVLYRPPPKAPLATKTVTAATRIQSENHGFLDFEIGRNLGIGAGSPQLNVALRIARFDHKASLGGSATTTTTTTPTPMATPVQHLAVLTPFNASGRSRFLGVGPRVSLDGSLPIGGPALSIDYGFGAAMIYGKRDSSYSYSAAGRTANRSSENHGWHANLDASLALGWQFTPSAKMSVGYKVEYWQGILESFDPAAGTFSAENRVAYGPFASFALRF